LAFRSHWEVPFSILGTESLTSFALKTLLADRRKLFIALIGVIFSLVLVNIQGGMFIGLIRKSTLLVDNCAADIWVGHRGVKNADITADIPVSWIYRVRGVPGVARAEPYVVSGGMLELRNGDFEGVLVVGCDSASMLGGPWSFAEGDINRLREPDAVTIDRLDESRLANPKIGELLEINGNKARITAKTDGIVGFITTPYVFTTLERARLYTRIPEGHCSYFLVTLETGYNIDAVVSEIQRRLSYADVYPASDFSWKTRMYWIVRTGLGMSFGSSTLLGLAVGLMMVAQSLYAFVLDHLENYAALKAIGATDRQIAGILMTQGVVIATLGCVVGHLFSWLIVVLVSSPQLTIAVTPILQIAATVMAFSICLISSLLPIGRIRNVDPVTVLQGQ
jgi:putative ABC transport system permease protein